MLYEIPNYCINDPYKYEIEEEKDRNNHDNIEEVFINVSILKIFFYFLIKIDICKEIKL